MGLTCIKKQVDNIAKSMHNKSLHPIWSVGPAFASFSYGAANAGPPAQTGELNRYPEETDISPCLIA